jgi:hypothetical protein
MILSLPANPVPSELYQFINGGTSPIWLPWYVWGGGVYATKYPYNPSKFFGYLGTVSVPLAGAGACPVIIKSLRMTGHNSAGSMVRGALFQRTGNLSAPIATVLVTSPGYFDITQSAGNFAATPSVHSLAIELFGDGQGIATITALFVELQY